MGRLAPGIRARLHHFASMVFGRQTLCCATGRQDRTPRGFGWASEGWTLSKAKAELARLKEASRTGDGPTTLAEKRQQLRCSAEPSLSLKSAKPSAPPVLPTTGKTITCPTPCGPKRISWQKEVQHSRTGWLRLGQPAVVEIGMPPVGCLMNTLDKEA